MGQAAQACGQWQSKAPSLMNSLREIFSGVIMCTFVYHGHICATGTPVLPNSLTRTLVMRPAQPRQQRLQVSQLYRGPAPDADAGGGVPVPAAARVGDARGVRGGRRQ